MNRLKTMILLASLTALLLWVGQALGGTTGLVIALLVAAAMNFASYWFSDRIVLRMHGAQELTPQEAPELYAATSQLAIRAGLPMPRLYLMQEDAPNAFATGRNPAHGAVAVTEGLLRLLSPREVAAVIAHELGHIRNRDTLIMTAAATIGGALSMIGNMAAWSMMMGRSDEDEGPSPLGGLFGMLLAPVAATIIQMAISRSREFLADEAAARFTADPMALASALRRIEGWSHQIPMAAGTPATAHLFISNPFSGGGLMKLFSTHPPMQERVERLEAMALSGRHLAAV